MKSGFANCDINRELGCDCRLPYPRHFGSCHTVEPLLVAR
jgi:hypothetical protein